MNKHIAFIASLISFSVLSVEGYRLKMNVLLDDKVISSPEISVEKGQKATLTQEDSKTNIITEISILASEKSIQGENGIFLDLEISHIIDKDKTIVSKPKVLVKEGEEALFETASSDNDEKFQLKIYASKVNL